MLQEEWKPIKGYEGLYEISNFGRVKSKKRHPDIILKYGISNGYRIVTLYNRGIKNTKKISLLVWDHFGGSLRDSRRLQVDHIDNNKQNDKVINLQLLTARENITKSFRQYGTKNNLPTGVRKHGKKFQAQIKLNGRTKPLGTYSTPALASLEYQKELKKIIQHGT